ncbi:MAG TPA: hypothetical protein VLN45_10415, partial [Ignavibacteriaceae bacterium]|nr:hypothetical protein [Ignavibacteriaceae bacterium]
MKIISLFLFFLISFSSFSQNQPTVFLNAKIYPVSGEPIENGFLLIHNGKIVEVGSMENFPPGKEEDIIVFNVKGKIIMPGLVDTHSHIGEGDGGDRSSTTHPGVRILDAIDPQSDTFKKAIAGGITTVNVMP